MSNKVTITLQENNSEVVIEQNGIFKKKTITAEQLLECIQNAIENKKTDNKATLGETLVSHVGDNFVGYKTSKDENTKYYCIFRNMKNTPVTINYCDIEYSDIQLPNILFASRVVGGKHNCSFIVCTYEDNITDETKLYNFPFPNVFGNTSICWGANGNSTFLECKSTDVSKLLSMFLTMQFTDHNFSYNNKCGMPVRKFLDYLKDKGTINKEWLVPHNTFKQWFDKI